MSVKEFEVAASADEGNGICGKLINQQPIAAQMAFAKVFHVPDKWVISVDGRTRFDNTRR